jgi:hypothetical protein
MFVNVSCTDDNLSRVEKCTKYSRTALIRINWDEELSGNVENLDSWNFFFFFFFENGLHRQFAVGKIYTNGCFRLHIYLRTDKI